MISKHLKLFLLTVIYCIRFRIWIYIGDETYAFTESKCQQLYSLACNKLNAILLDIMHLMILLKPFKVLDGAVNPNLWTTVLEQKSPNNGPRDLFIGAADTFLCAGKLFLLFFIWTSIM